MTVAELIEKLQTLDPNYVVVVHDLEDYPSFPNPIVRYEPYDTHYWDETGNVSHIPENTHFVVL